MIKIEQNKYYAKVAKDDHPGTKDWHPRFKKSGKDDEPSL
jgi:hypothetical protein